MKCKVCGFVSEDMTATCPNCGSSSIENNSIVNSKIDNNSTSTMKCPKCGHENLSNSLICENCEYPLNRQIKSDSQLNDNKIYDNQVNIKNDYSNSEESSKKSILTFVGFSILYTIVPLIIGFMMEGTMLSNIALFIFVFGIEPLTCLTVKSITKSTKYMKTELLILSFVLIALWMIPFIIPSMGMVQTIPLVMVIIKFIVWFITRKIFIKDKIVFNKKIFVISILYVILILMISSLSGATPTNKLLFKTFGNTEFSSKKLYIELINAYNLDQKGIKNDVSYMHKLTNEELNKVKELTYVEAKMTNDDLQKLPNLKSLAISEDIELDKELDFSSNKKLKELNIFGSGVEKIILPESIKVLNTGEKSTIKDLDISNLSKLNKISGTFNVLAISDLSNIDNSESFIVVNKLMTKDNQSIELSNRKKIKFSFNTEYKDNIYLPEHIKTNDIIVNNLKLVFTNYSKKIIDTEKEIERMDNIILYDKNDNIIMSFEIIVGGY